MMYPIKDLLDREMYEELIEQFEKDNHIVFQEYLDTLVLEEEIGDLENISKIYLQVLGFFQYYYNITQDLSKKIKIGHMIIIVSTTPACHSILNGYQFAFSYLKKLYKMDFNNPQTCNAILSYSSYPDFPSDYFTYDIQEKAYNSLKKNLDLEPSYEENLKEWRGKGE